MMNIYIKSILLFLFLLLLNACSKSNNPQHTQKQQIKNNYFRLIKEKNFSLTQEQALKYFFFTEGIDSATNEPNSEAEADLYYSLLDSQTKFITYKNFKILQTTPSYALLLFHVEDTSFAATFQANGTPINFLLLEKYFGTNEFHIKREFKQVNDNRFKIVDERHDTQWIVYPTQGKDILTRVVTFNITLNEKGFFILSES